MRKAGVIAAPGIYALEKMVDRLLEDHENARRLAEGVRDISGIGLDMETIQTNMVKHSVAGLGLTAREYISALLEKGVKASEVGQIYGW